MISRKNINGHAASHTHTENKEVVKLGEEGIAKDGLKAVQVELYGQERSKAELNGKETLKAELNGQEQSKAELNGKKSP